MKFTKASITKIVLCLSLATVLMHVNLLTAQAFDQTKDPYTFGGKVGIGTTSPTDKFEVQINGITGSGIDTVSGLVLRAPDSQNSPALTFTGGGPYGGDIGKIVYDSGNSRFNFWGGGFGVPAGAEIIWDGVSQANSISVPSRGNAIFRFRSSINLNTETDNTGTVIIPYGNVGIGTTEPTTKLTVNGSIALSQPNAISFGGIGAPKYNALQVDNIGDIVIGGGGATPWQNIRFFAAASEKVTINGNGNVGIGRTDPQALLHVAGNIQVDGNINAKYQDLAEYVKTSASLTSGMVVMIDTKEVNQVVPSDRAYNTLVAGVVSETPGIILGEGGADKAIIAHTGRVKVKVDTSSGKISAGDLLVTSPMKGYAMKADTDKLKPGMLLGKALEPLKEGQQGEILALITLQ